VGISQGQRVPGTRSAAVTGQQVNSKSQSGRAVFDSGGVLSPGLRRELKESELGISSRRQRPAPNPQTHSLQLRRLQS